MIEKITADEFPALLGGRRAFEETKAVKDLLVGEGVKFPCRWKHSLSCHGGRTLYSTARRHRMKISLTCREKTIYVLRTS